uniref:Zn(2)-C6 fungal-type domain-containing protein n=1 Tax=Fusarium oxysporum (strain Fo5176) TaxID=660025 RepID=A0A0D2XFY9_FUSOF
MPPRRACDTCYKRKIQCLIKTQGDPCDWCDSQGLTCTFDRVIQKDPNKRTTSDVVQELSRRVETLEEALQTALTNSTNMSVGGPSPWSEPTSLRFASSPITRQPVISPIGVSPTTRSKPVYKLCRCHIGTNWYFKGIGILSNRGWQWISDGAGERVFLENFDIFGNPAPPLGSVSFSETPRVLPPRAICAHVVELFFKSKTAVIFPFLERGLFEGTLGRAFDEGVVDLGRRAPAEACLWAMIALIVRTIDAQQLGFSFEPGDCVNEASRLLGVVSGITSLDSLQGTLLLDMSLRTDKPPLLTSDHCDISDAEDQTLWYSHPRDTNLARIKENASNILCSPRAFKYTEGELLAHVRQLDDELEEWRLSVDPRYRPRLSILSDLSFSLPAAMNLQDRTYLINLQLDYLFTIINIHTLVRKCGDLEENLPDDLHSVVHSSADLSIEASRSIFRILDTIVDLWKEDSLWIVSHYAPMAAMPLFMNILIHPLGSSADNDLHILSSISKITRKVPSDRLPMEEIEHIQEISEFVMELVRLSHSAAWKVKRGEREHDLDIIHT